MLIPSIEESLRPRSEVILHMLSQVSSNGENIDILMCRMPNMSDAVRKRTLAEFVVKTKKQVVKLYVAVKWARDASAVQKAMVRGQVLCSHSDSYAAISQNVTAFLTDQNQQFEDAVKGLQYAKDSLDPARYAYHSSPCITSHARTI